MGFRVASFEESSLCLADIGSAFVPLMREASPNPKVKSLGFRVLIAFGYLFGLRFKPWAPSMGP